VIQRTRLRSRPRPGWERVRQDVWKRSGGRCEVELELADWQLLQVRGFFRGARLGPGNTRCPESARDCHHVVKRSQGGEDDPSNVIAICRVMHDLTDRALALGRLVIEPQGNQRFVSRVDVKPSKWSWSA
jgi:5-methylcytosine-specific restriction endonuclease McrA